MEKIGNRFPNITLEQLKISRDGDLVRHYSCVETGPPGRPGARAKIKLWKGSRKLFLPYCEACGRIVGRKGRRKLRGTTFAIPYFHPEGRREWFLRSLEMLQPSAPPQPSFELRNVAVDEDDEVAYDPDCSCGSCVRERGEGR